MAWQARIRYSGSLLYVLKNLSPAPAAAPHHQSTLKARSHCTYGRKSDVNRKKMSPSVGKRWVSLVYSLRACCKRSLHRASAHRDWIRTKSFELHKTFRADELSAVYDINPPQLRARCVRAPLPPVKRPLCPLCILAIYFRCRAKRTQGGQIR